jgi:hypothetical protein
MVVVGDSVPLLLAVVVDGVPHLLLVVIGDGVAILFLVAARWGVRAARRGSSFVPMSSSRRLALAFGVR